MSENNGDREEERMFQRLVGAADKAEGSPEEAQDRRERLEQGNPQLRDAIAELPAALERQRRHYLDLYDLNDAYTQDEKEVSEATFSLMSEEQEQQFRRAVAAYRKRKFRIEDKDDRMNSLASFAVTNPPEVLRRHVWRLQRGLDEPLFGEETERRPNNSVRQYKATVAVSLCDRCARELEQETEEAGAERPPSKYLRHSNFYDRRGVDFGGPMNGYYLFKYEDMYVERVDRGFFSSFPLRDPKECARCGTDDVTLWRERFGSK